MKVKELLGVSAVSLMKYGVAPDDNVKDAIKILEVRAPHIAKLLGTIVENNS